MALVSMKMEQENELEMETNEYGYGLCIRLEPEQCAALGITTLPKAGSTITLSAKTTVKRVTEEAGEPEEGDTGNEVYLELQITDMEIQNGATTNETAASVLYQPPSPTAQVVNPAIITRLG